VPLPFRVSWRSGESCAPAMSQRLPLCLGAVGTFLCSRAGSIDPVVYISRRLRRGTFGTRLSLRVSGCGVRWRYRDSAAPGVIAAGAASRDACDIDSVYARTARIAALLSLSVTRGSGMRRGGVAVVLP